MNKSLLLIEKIDSLLSEEVMFYTNGGKGYGSISRSDPDHAKVLRTLKGSSSSIKNTGKTTTYQIGPHQIHHHAGIDGSITGSAEGMQHLNKLSRNF